MSDNNVIKGKVVAAYVGLKQKPMLTAFQHNTFNPKFNLHLEYIEFRGGFFTQKVSYDEIESIDIYFMAKHTKNLILERKGKSTALIANFLGYKQLWLFVKILSSKGCTLTNKAQHFLDTGKYSKPL